MAETGAADWADGYVVDVEYVHNFHPGLAPTNLALACALSGVRPPDVDTPFTYLDLGCGDGFTATVVAAANPRAAVWGNDFNPAHVRAARATAVAGGVANARFVEASFADLLDADLPAFDMVVAHGIWTWVSPANRDCVLALLRRRVKPGGVVMVSYNCHPGWDGLMPLRRLLFTGAGQGGSTAERVERGLAAARRLCDAGANYFVNTPAAADTLAHLERADRAYIAHEYLNEHWTVFEPAEVAAQLASAGLTYAGQARVIDGIDRFCVTGAQAALLDAEPDAAARAVLRDLMLDRRFRHDLFVREPEAVDRDAWLDARRFVLVRPRAACALSVKAPVGPVTLPEQPFAPLLDALAEGPAAPRTLAARLSLPPAATREALVALVAAGMVQAGLAREGEAERRASTERFNAAALGGARMGEWHPALASPVTGSGIGVSAGDQLLLDAGRVGIPPEAISTDHDPADGNPVERFRTETLPVLERLGIA